MENYFTIEVGMKVLESWFPFCIFKIGIDRSLAMSIFEMLETVKDGLLRFTLVESNGDRKTLATKPCTLHLLESNSRIITKEIFKTLNFEGGG